MSKKKGEYKPKIFYYDEVTDDFLATKKQDYVLPDDYVYMPKGILYKIKSAVIYFFAKIYAFFCCKFYLRVTIKNRKVIKKVKHTGYFIYGNHTNPLNDAFTPALVANKRIYTICSPANFGIPIMGLVLKELGGIPLGKNQKQKKEFRETVDQRIKEGKCVVIYPEAHLWPYYTGVRDFPNKSFKYPVDLNVPIFCMTTTYQKSKFFEVPKITVYVDGPFYKDERLSVEENREKLKQDIYNTIKERIKNTNYEYYKYVPRKKGSK